MTGFEPADMAALREQGDLKAFMLSLAGRTPKPRAAAEPTPPPHLPRARPGAWPDGTHPPAPPPPVSAEEFARASAEYREWLAAGCPSTDRDGNPIGEDQ